MDELQPPATPPPVPRVGALFGTPVDAVLGCADERVSPLLVATTNDQDHMHVAKSLMGCLDHYGNDLVDSRRLSVIC